MATDPPIEQRIACECLAGRIRLLNRVVTGLCNAALRPYQMRVSQMNVLVAIAAMGPVRATDVCRQLCLDKSTLSRDLERLLAQGWVRATPAKGRTQHLEATATGRALIAKVTPAWEAVQEQLRQMLGATLTKELYEAANRLHAANADED